MPKQQARPMRDVLALHVLFSGYSQHTISIGPGIERGRTEWRRCQKRTVDLALASCFHWHLIPTQLCVCWDSSRMDGTRCGIAVDCLDFHQWLQKILSTTSNLITKGKRVANLRGSELPAFLFSSQHHILFVGDLILGVRTSTLRSNIHLWLETRILDVSPPQPLHNATVNGLVYLGSRQIFHMNHALGPCSGAWATDTSRRPQLARLLGMFWHLRKKLSLVI